MQEGTQGSERDPGGRALLELRERIRAEGLREGFARVGVAVAPTSDAERRLQAWLDRGFHGEMGWMARDPGARTDPERILPGFRAAVCVALRYGRPEPVPPDPRAPRISRYAWGRDYHAVMEEKLARFEQAIVRLAETARGAGSDAETGLPEQIRTRRACDTSPVMDKAWAEAAGIGWLGKNACLIHPQEGSWFFLGEIFTNLPLLPDAPVADRCGTCRRCLEACPTGTLVEPYLLDARRCISYLTIEHRTEFDPEQEAAVGEWLVGCDLCQDVCPWNRRAPHSADPAFAPDGEVAARRVEDWIEIEDESYRAAVRDSAIRRIKPAMMRRNARAVRRNRARRSG